MGSESDEPSAQGGLGDLIETASDVISDIATGLPAPVRKNFWKAFGQLCTAAVDVPVAMLEGKAAEFRAESQARVRLVARSAEQLADQMKVEPEYVRAAAHKFTARVVREQINLDKVSLLAAAELKKDTTKESSSSESQSTTEISANWLNAFEREASQVSEADMQGLFAKVLAGEVRKPSTFSIKSVKLLGEIDTSAAKYFRRLCSMTSTMKGAGSSFVVDARVVSLGHNAAQNGLRDYGLRFDTLNLLQEYGLIIADYNSYIDYAPVIANDALSVSMSFDFGSNAYGLLRKSKADITRPPDLKVHGVALTNSAIELLRIVDKEPVPAYEVAFREYWDKLGFELVPILFKSP